ncbi:hypothetical protein GQ600_18137 [Phytophthora cactorum]|nr:hypothetical protein GQ600_18137 [Phytophthora cactorum]
MSEAEQFKSVSYSKKRAASSTTQLRFLLDRFFTLYWRTPPSQAYNVLWYFASFTIVELPYAFVGAFLFTIIYYPIVGLEGFADGVIYWINAYMGQLLVFVVPSIEVAAVIGILFNAVCLLAPQASTLQATSGFTPSHHCVYSFSALAAIAFGKCSNDQLNAPASVSVDAVFGIKHAHIAQYVGIMIGMIVLFCVRMVLAMRYINHRSAV